MLICFEMCDSIKVLTKTQTLLKKKKNTIQMNLHTKQTDSQTESKLTVTKGERHGERETRNLELTYTHYHI